MQNLGKDNFWEPIKEKYPLAVERFCEWIDEYKEIVGWNKMFGSNVKFHDIPYEMQMGIMNRFFIENFASKEEFAKNEKEEFYHGEMARALKQLNKRLVKAQ